MTPILKILACSALLGAAALTGCASTEATAAATSELTGSLAQSTFPAAVTSITVARDDGTTAVTPVGADGTFSALLEKGGTYRLLLSADGLGTPVVLDASNGRLRTTIQVTSAGGSIDIGSIAYWDPTGASAKTQALDVSTTVTTTDASCIDGVIAGTRQACATTEAPVDCSAANDMSHGCVNMGDDAATTPAVAAAAAAAAAVDTDADATLPMGLPAENAPEQIACAAAGGHGRHHGH